MLKGGFRSQPLVNEAFEKSKNSYVALSILQGSGLKEKETRLNLEKMIINYAGLSSINILGKKKIKPNPLLSDPSIKRAQFSPHSQSWDQYDLKYNSVNEKRKEGCIYLFMHRITKNLYIGESSDFYGAKVLRRHRATITQVQALTLQNQKMKCANAYNLIVNDILNSGTDFLYSIIEYTGDLSPRERKIREASYIVEAQKLYGDRLYNPPTSGLVANTKKRSEASKQLNRIATIAARQTRKTIHRKSYPCVINGVWYNSMVEAGRALGLTVKGTIKCRLLSPKFPDYIWLKDQVNKDFPEDPSLREKIRKFYDSLSSNNGEEGKKSISQRNEAFLLSLFFFLYLFINTEGIDKFRLILGGGVMKSRVRANDPLIYIGDRRSPPIYIYIGGVGSLAESDP